MAERPRSIRPARHIRQKVKRGGPSPEKAILKALNAAEKLIDDYQGWAIDDLQKLWQLFVDTAAGGGPNKDEIRQIFNLAHEARGQGGSFGYPLISILGDSLCKHLDERASVTEADLELVKVHILAMKAIFRQDLKGKQGNLSRELPGLLAALREKMDEEEAPGGPRVD